MEVKYHLLRAEGWAKQTISRTGSKQRKPRAQPQDLCRLDRNLQASKSAPIGCPWERERTARRQFALNVGLLRPGYTVLHPRR
jgi:hypothetical protein